MGRVRRYPEDFRAQAASLVVDSGRGVRDVARELGINHETLRNRVGQARRDPAAAPAVLSGDERLELAWLRKVAELELEREILKMCRGLLHQGDGSVTRRAELTFIDAEKTTYGVRRLCRVMNVSPSSHPVLVRRVVARAGGPTPAQVDEAYGVNGPRDAWVEHRHAHGARRLTSEVRERGHAWNRKHVARLMRLCAVEGAHRRRRGKCGRRNSWAATAPEPVARQFTAGAPNRGDPHPQTCSRPGAPHRPGQPAVHLV